MNFDLLKLYVPLVSWVSFGLVLGFKLPQTVPLYLGKFLFWIGVPISIVTFLRQADLAGSVWLAPATAWAAMALGAILAWSWIQGRSPGELSSQTHWSQPAQGSFLLAAMFGNTGYLGYPVTLTLVGPKYFAWAIFYDVLGSTLGAYGLGVAIAARLGMNHRNQRQLLLVIFSNPGLWSFAIGLGMRQVPLPEPVEQGLRACAWIMVAFSLLLMGMRLSQLTSWQNVHRASISLGIKMVIVPLVLGTGLLYLGVAGPPHLVIVLQMAMPPAFATLIIAEAYNLDKELTVTALGIGSLGLLAMLPIWIALFAE